MRLIKMLGLAMVAAVAAMAFIGSSSAMAAHQTAVCKVNPGAGLCPDASLYPAGQTLLGSLEPLFLKEGKSETHAVLLGTINQLCTESHVEGKLTNSMPAHGEITGLTFKGCSPCKTITMLNLPYLVELLMSGSSYTMLVKGKEASKPILVDFDECTFGVECEFETSDVTLDVKTTASGLALIEALKESLKLQAGLSSFFCGSTGTWDANYLVTSPHPTWLSLDE